MDLVKTQMLNSDVINAMRRTGALLIDRSDGDNLVFHINFSIVEQLFPSYMEYLVRLQLSELDLTLYDSGYIAYFVSDSGNLIWKPTKKATDIVNNAKLEDN